MKVARGVFLPEEQHRQRFGGKTSEPKLCMVSVKVMKDETGRAGGVTGLDTV